jgi:benzoyl-CoA reductase/2-hydroxyglutaryl-CoA dehydratase subunit BcrC/BadD/HgdB
MQVKQSIESPFSLSQRLVSRIMELEEEKAKGKKIVGYYPSEYVPEELIMASGAVPLGLAKGGEYGAVLNSGKYIPRWNDTFCRAQIGYRAMGDFFYSIIDLYVCFSTHFTARAIVDNYNFFAPELDTYRLEIPHSQNDLGFDYYVKGINKFKDKMQELTGNEITNSNLTDAVKLCNRERDLLRQLSLLREPDGIRISGHEYVSLNHASYVLEKESMITMLEQLLESKKALKPSHQRPRIMLAGSALAMSDYGIYEMVEENKAAIVIEYFGEAMRDYWTEVEPEGNLQDSIHNLAKRYFYEKVVNFAFRPSRGYRQFLVKLAKQFRVDGVIWYQPMYQDNGDFEFIMFSDLLKKEMPVPLLKLYTEYDSIERSALETRVETFIEVVKSKVK